MAIGPVDYYGDLDPDPEPDWPDELPEWIEIENAHWRSITLPFKPFTESKAA